MKNRKRAGLILLATATLTLVVAQPASAAVSALTSGSAVRLEGNTLTVTDTRNDGKSAIGQYRTGGVGAAVYQLVNSGGNGAVKSMRVELPLGGRYYIRACVYDISQSGPLSCGGWVEGRA